MLKYGPNPYSFAVVCAHCSSKNVSQWEPILPVKNEDSKRIHPKYVTTWFRTVMQQKGEMPGKTAISSKLFREKDKVHFSPSSFALKSLFWKFATGETSN